MIHFFIHTLPIRGDAILSPMDGYSDQPFRSLCRELGSAMSYTEFVKAEDILERVPYVDEKLAFTEAERPVTIQIYGDNPGKILDAALLVQEHGPDVIDVNMGCPAKTISARGAGVGLMRNPEKIAKIFRLLTAHLEVPVTGKIRLGWDEESRNYLEVAKIVEDNGGQLLAVHGRTKQQGYGGQADWDAIAEIVDALSIPVIGNGDVNTVADIERIRAYTGCAGVMIGRAAMSNPWFFSRLDRECVPPDVVRKTMLRHLELNLDFYGAARGLVLFRKFAARYLTPYTLPREIRQHLMTRERAEEFVELLNEIVEGVAA
ncbi:MAG TPA: tRNA-dihydrouridine synthase family protein [Anaerolineales bacterium]|nr:tRNA-dihydrouridine synthase family protein [Anaerolineales bacterium]